MTVAVAIGGQAALAAPVAGPAVVVQAEALTLPSAAGVAYADPAASAGRALLLWSNGTASGTAATARRSDTLLVTARADLCEGAPVMAVSVDGALVSTRTVTATSWTSYATTGSWAPGTHRVAVSFTNDRGTRSCDRNLRLDAVALRPVPEALPTPAATPTLTPTPTPTPTPSTARWSVRMTAGTSPLVDALGRTWSPAQGLLAGSATPVWGGIAGSASETLYRSARLGAVSWTVPVPAPGRYAVDLLVSDPTGARAGDRVFDVVATDPTGTEVALQRGVDIVATARGWWAHHVTGTVTVGSGPLVLRFVAHQGSVLVNALAVNALPATTGAGFSDDFTGAAGSAPSPLWNVRTGSGPWGDGELQAYTGSRANSALTGNGVLALTARRESWSDAYGTRPYTSARLDTKGRATFTYGHVEARMQVSGGQGLWPAFWALGADIDAVDWPRSGELDVMEHLGGQPSTVFGHLHGLGDAQDPLGWRSQPVSDAGRGFDTGQQLSQGWHTYAMDVTPDYVTFSVDGREYVTVTPYDMRPGQQWPVGKPYYLVLNLAVGGSWGGAPDASSMFPSTTLVDRVTVTD